MLFDQYSSTPALPEHSPCRRLATEALFGAPLAYEDSPRRAVHAALGMQCTLPDFGHEIQAQHGVCLQTFGAYSHVGLSSEG